MALGQWGLDGWGTGSFALSGFAPVINSFVPVCGAANVAASTIITFNVVDPNPVNPGIDLNNTTVTVQIGTTSTETAFTAGAFTADYLPGSSTSAIT